MTLIPWECGRSLLWGFTCTDTVVPSNQAWPAPRRKQRGGSIHPFFILITSHLYALRQWGPGGDSNSRHWPPRPRKHRRPKIHHFPGATTRTRHEAKATFPLCKQTLTAATPQRNQLFHRPNTRFTQVGLTQKQSFNAAWKQLASH